MTKDFLNLVFRDFMAWVQIPKGKLLAMLDGVKLSTQLGYSSIQIESDSQVVVNKRFVATFRHPLF